MATTITATKSETCAEVDIITAYIGGKSDRYDTIPTIDADRRLIDIFWRDAGAWAGAIAGAAMSPEGETLRLAIDGPEPAGIEGLLRSALARYIIWRWLQICAPAEADAHLAQAREAMGRVRSLAVGHPARRSIPPM